MTLHDANPWLAAADDAVAALTPSDREDLAAPRSSMQLYSPAAARIAALRRQYQLVQIERGRDVWNRWAESMLAHVGGNANRAGGAALAEIAAHVDLSGLDFASEMDMGGFLFPGRLSLEKTSFRRGLFAQAITVTGATVMEDARIDGDLTLASGSFEGACHFSGMRLAARLEGRGMRFAGTVDWRHGRFGKDAWFSASIFGDAANFSSSRFASDAGFSGARFDREARFEHAAFEDTVGMEACVFAGRLDLRRASFARGIFMNDARFALEPEIGAATFVRAPVLTGAVFPEDRPQEVAVRPSLRAVGRSA